MKTVITKVSTQKISRLLTKNGFCKSEGIDVDNWSEAFYLKDKYSSGIVVHSSAIRGEFNEDTAAYCKKMLDLLIENKVIIELKAVEALNDVHMAQVLTYLKLSGCKLGLLMNFNVLRIVDGLKRFVNKL